MKSTAPSVPHPGPRLAHARVSDAMSPRVLSCDPSTPLATAAQRLDGEGVHALIVMDPVDGRRPSGLVTDAVVLRHAEDADRFTAGEVAARDVLEVFADEPLVGVVRRMAGHGLTHAVVLDEPSGQVVGVLAASDVVRVVAWGRS
jgi:CBS domain-containing protein